ncbi:hypothetical protein TruAng_011273 [Truncatella angustata]|nr:hypothetical protein TruAng_011273 [Truncatella angustata]
MNIPGYYFDPEKKRYFKIEGSQTAPTQSVWSHDSVKKRKLEDENAAEVLRRLTLNKYRIKRAQALNDPFTGGFLAREYGSTQQDMMPAVLADSFVEKGSISFIDNRWSPSQNLSSICIIGDDPWTDLGIGYVCPDGSALTSTYLPRDKNGRVHRQLLTGYDVPGHHIAPYHEASLDQISSVKFHRRRGILIVASREPKEFASLRAVKPLQAHCSQRQKTMPFWQLGMPPYAQNILTTGPPIIREPSSENPRWPKSSRPNNLARRPLADFHFKGSRQYEVNAVAVGPDWSDDIICAVGTNRGMLLWKGEHCSRLSGSFDWVAPTMSSRLLSDKAFHDIFAVEFRRGHENVIFGGGRSGRCFLADTRLADTEWMSFRHASSITHIRSLNEHHVLVSGLESTLETYDLRMIKGHTRIVSTKGCENSQRRKADRSVISFPEYKNNAHNKIGFDVDLEAGIVAAAHDNGKLALYSLKSGHRVKSSCIDRIDAGAIGRGPIEALQFEKMSRDLHSSLFIGVGRHLKVCSLGMTDNADEI